MESVDGVGEWGNLRAGISLAGRYVYAILATVFALGVVAQVFLAGVGVFGADWNLHTTFVHFIELLLPVMFVSSFVGWTTWRLTLAPVGLWALFTAQYAFAYADGPVLVSSLHALNALVIFSVSVLVVRSAWRVATRKTARRRNA